MGILRPEHHSFAHRVGGGIRETPRDVVVIAPDLIGRFVGVENAVDPGEFPQHAPVQEIIGFLIDVAGIIQQDGILRIQSGNEIPDFLIAPRGDEIPAGDQQRGMRIMFPQFVFDPPERITFEIVVPLMVGETAAFRQSDGMEHFRCMVFAQLGFRKFPVAFHIDVFPDVPDLPFRTAFIAVLFRDESRLETVQEFRRGEVVPMRHGAAVGRHDQSARPGIIIHFPQHFGAVFRFPEHRPVEMAVPPPFRRLLAEPRIRDHIRKRFLEQIFDPGPDRKQVQPFFHDPVDFLFPVRQIPVFRLETVQSAMGEITDPPILESRLFMHIQSIQRDVFLLGNAVAVPEIPAIADPFEKVINRVEISSCISAKNQHSALFPRPERMQPVIVRAVPERQIGQAAVQHQLMDEGGLGIRSENDQFPMTSGRMNDRQFFAGNRFPVPDEFFDTIRRDFRSGWY